MIGFLYFVATWCLNQRVTLFKKKEIIHESKVLMQIQLFYIST